MSQDLHKFILTESVTRKLEFFKEENLGPRQAPITCNKLELFLSKRIVDRTGDCSINKECTRIYCFLNTDVPEPNNNVTEYITFYPCSKPISVHVILWSTQQDDPTDPIININTTSTQTVNHKHIGKFQVLLTQLTEGVKFGVCYLT